MSSLRTKSQVLAWMFCFHFLPCVLFNSHILFTTYMLNLLDDSLSVLTDIYTVPDTCYLEHLMALTNSVTDFGSKIFLVADIVSSQCVLE